jgi:glycosyltransferase involved in cell wall biosynthesis
VRILVDYRPALRARTGVGEYVHELVRALLSTSRGLNGELVLFTSSWKDRPAPVVRAELAGATIVDRRVPVSLLTRLWNGPGWPPVEMLAGTVDVAHSISPVLIPARHAAQVITIHDLHFLRHPERMAAEMRRDFPRLVRDHACRAHAVTVVSRFVAAEVVATLDVPEDRVYVCPAGAPSWAASVANQRVGRAPRHILFLGTVEPRKNIGVLLEAYAALRSRIASAPPLVIAGGLTPAAAPWVDRAREGPLAGHVRFAGYVSEEERRSLLAEAHMLVQPSIDEGFGLPVLEAMAVGVPVVISSGGALPEVAGQAASPIAPDDAEAFARAMTALLDPEAARDASARGLRRARDFSWTETAATVANAYKEAVNRR